MTDHNHLTRDIKTLGKCPGCDEYNQHQARRILAESGATLEDVRMNMRDALILGGCSWMEADSLILLHEAAVTRA